MPDSVTPTLDAILTRWVGDARLEPIQSVPSDISACSPTTLKSIYSTALALMQGEMAERDYELELVALYQALWREYESLLPDEARHDIVIAIPVADRPQHLRDCLESIHTLCRCYHYGGFANGCFQRIRVIIADDSRDEHNRRQHREMAERMTASGLSVEYLSPEQQFQLLRRCIPEEGEGRNIVAEHPESAFFHKGPSVTRNIVYLRLCELSEELAHPLFLFIDSDQEFQVKIQAGSGDCDRYAVNYFAELNRLFLEQPIDVVTGKVVGDPPVSPAVMAGNFLADVGAFLKLLSGMTAEERCHFHQYGNQADDDAAYHDMAELFGFKRQSTAFDYQCPLDGTHTVSESLRHFAGQLNHFFYGEHPTRKTYYTSMPIEKSIAPARTIYTGNYAFNRNGLRYFIPFAGLRLRMAGPVLGRLIKAQIGSRFISANLPMLHKRTVGDTGKSEFRPGIDGDESLIDMSGEFERQFFGDVMLFSMERLTAEGFPKQVFSSQQIDTVVSEVAEQLLGQYREKHVEIGNTLAAVSELIRDPAQWWNNEGEDTGSREAMEQFVATMQHNFGDEAEGYRLINDPNHRKERLHQMIQAIQQYPADSAFWTSVLQ